MIRLPGEPLELQPSVPLLPLAHMPKMPDAVQASLMSSMNGSFDGSVLPHELLMMFGRLLDVRVLAVEVGRHQHPLAGVDQRLRRSGSSRWRRST